MDADLRRHDEVARSVCQPFGTSLWVDLRCGLRRSESAMLSLRPASYIPKPGDLYYLRCSDDHVGIIEDIVSGKAGAILMMTINGNGFDQRQENFAELVECKTPLDGGFGSRNSPTNLLDGSAKGRDAFHIALPAS